jgi:hypothetical protein
VGDDWNVQALHNNVVQSQRICMRLSIHMRSPRTAVGAALQQLRCV